MHGVAAETIASSHRHVADEGVTSPLSLALHARCDGQKAVVPRNSATSHRHIAASQKTLFAGLLGHYLGSFKQRIALLGSIYEKHLAQDGF